MEGRFLRGVMVGGVMGAVIASQWDALLKKCPFLEEIKGSVLLGDMEKTYRKSMEKPRSKTRLMARRHRV